MAVSARITNIQPRADGGWIVTFSDGSGTEFLTLEELRGYIGDLESEETAKKFAIALALNVSNDFKNLGGVVPMQVIVDVTSNNLVRRQN